MKIPSLFRNKERWPSCKYPKTLSFRAGDDMFKTVNSIFFDPILNGVKEAPENLSSFFTDSSSETASFSTESEDYLHKSLFDGESLESVISEVVKSERLLFEPGSDTSSILEETKPGGFPFKESVVLALESDDPYVDFRRSMEEMVEFHGLKDLECLEELLVWYLKVNGKKHHGFIVGAFVDLLVGINAASSSSSLSSCPCSDSATFTSTVSSLSSSLTTTTTHLGSIKRANEIEMVGEKEAMLLS